MQDYAIVNGKRVPMVGKKEKTNAEAPYKCWGRNGHQVGNVQITEYGNPNGNGYYKYTNFQPISNN